tara:strand:- start:2791 stop:3708 length:918 start_codon:yes stop_codon:yes gene_type:complete
MEDGVGFFLKEAARIPMLSPAEEIELGNQVQAWQSLLPIENPNRDQLRVIRRGKKAKERMIKANLRLVCHIAKKHLKQTMTHMTLLDLIQEGCIGLNRGVEKFDPGRGYKFSTYAYWWIKQGIHRSIGNLERTIRLPVCAQDVQKRAAIFIDEYKHTHGKNPTLEEIAEVSRVTLPTLKHYLNHSSRPISLDRLTSHYGGSESTQEKTILDVLASEDFSPEEELEIQNGLEQLEDLLSILPHRDLKIMELRYGIGITGEGKQPMTYSEIGEIMDISRERVRQVEKLCLKRMRQKMHKRRQGLKQK